MTARVRWHQDFRKTAGYERPELVTGIPRGERAQREQQPTPDHRQIGINKEVVNLDGERMRGQRQVRWRKRFNFYFNGLSFVAELTKSIASNWLLTCLCLKQLMVVYFEAKHIFVKTRIKSTLF